MAAVRLTVAILLVDVAGRVWRRPRFRLAQADRSDGLPALRKVDAAEDATDLAFAVEQHGHRDLGDASVRPPCLRVAAERHFEPERGGKLFGFGFGTLDFNRNGAQTARPESLMHFGR